MPTATAHRKIDAPLEDVWSALDDFGNVYTFHPHVASSHSLDDVARGTGVRRQCDLYSGGSIREEVVNSVPGRRQVVDIFDTGPFPLEKNVATFELESVGGDRTRVEIEMSFVPAYGPVGWVMAHVVMKRRFRSLMTDILENLERHLQTGHLIGENGTLVPEAEY
jgi:carbon monoxide dehydrogenase subunit G